VTKPARLDLAFIETALPMRNPGCELEGYDAVRTNPTNDIRANQRLLFSIAKRYWEGVSFLDQIQKETWTAGRFPS
jgi:hypothetical protein